MQIRRPLLFAFGLALFGLAATEASAQRGRGGPVRGGESTPMLPSSPCPNCEKPVPPPADKPATFTCPHCGVKLSVKYEE